VSFSRKHDNYEHGNFTKPKTLDSVGEPWNAKQNPKYDAISYDPYKPPEKWKELSEQIFNDLCKATNGKEYDIMFHTGCTSNDWQKTAAGGHASSWKLVEHWSMMLTIASMRHALMHLAPGGQLYLKIRHFEKPETHGIITLLAQCFEKHQVYGRLIKHKTFVTFIGQNFLGKMDVQQISEHIAKCTDYSILVIVNTLSLEFSSSVK
jgi:hypothetical protein